MSATAELLRGLTVAGLLQRWPFADGFLADRDLDPEALAAAPLVDVLDGAGLDALAAFLEEMELFLSGEEAAVESIAVLGGRDKSGADEPVRRLDARVGEVICIVGPTGSGKSRLLADIEWVARGDTPTGRRVLIDGAEGDDRWRTSGDRKLVAQLSQNMNFVMDMGVGDFLALHAESRRADDIDAKVRIIWQE
ncbi:ATP-binding cassette domain-containing protein, partial [bacterium]|nr:ATP-binding cassette domain-containing protein [bacterium]